MAQAKKNTSHPKIALGSTDLAVSWSSFSSNATCLRDFGRQSPGLRLPHCTPCPAHVAQLRQHGGQF